MRLSLLTSEYPLILIQQLLILWFLSDFFLARDSLTADSLWKVSSRDVRQSEPAFLLADRVRQKYCHERKLEQSVFDKLIFIVIDALGSDFIPSLSNATKSSRYSMPYLEQLIQERRAIGFTAKAATPTVTMPRVKALTSGTIPSFVDILYNLASDVSKFDDDSIVSLAKAQNKSLVFYGDDTWLSLFDKRIFTRYKGTHSFFASDYTTVDTNVTEAALPETNLSIIDWDFLILHYLGLDHIGHVFGNNKNQLIDDKLVEMDNAIKVMHINMKGRNHKTLMVICGDHGMTEEGNHGGDKPLETNTAMIFLPINQNMSLESLTRTPIKQVDLSVTLAKLMGLPVPRSSKGVIIESLLNGLDITEEFKACAALDNLIELIDLINIPNFQISTIRSDLMELLEDHLKARLTSRTITSRYLDIARGIQKTLLEAVTSRSNPIALSISLAVVTLLSLMAMRKIGHRMLISVIPGREQLSCVVVFLFPILMQGSTDFIESEHYFWPIYSSGTFLIFMLIASSYNTKLFRSLNRLKLSLLLITILLTCTWNGFKLGRNDTIISPIISIIILCNYIRQNSDLRHHNLSSAIVLCLIIYIVKLFDGASYQDKQNVIYNAYLQMFAMFAAILHTIYGLYNSSDDSWLLRKLASGSIAVAFLLARAHNYPFLIGQVLLETSVNSILDCSGLSTVTRVLVYVGFAQSAFFGQGNSNLFSTIDVKPAFFGQTSYNAYMSVPLVAYATFSTQIFWYIKMLQRGRTLQAKLNAADERRDLSGLGLIRNFVIMRNFLSLSYYMYVCLVLKDHLFIWSVISPKLVYHFVSNSVLLGTLSISSIITSFAARRMEECKNF